MKKDKEECPICCDTYTDHLRKPIQCLHCGHICCRSCIAHYVLSISTSPHCMSCKKPWNHEFMYQSMNKTFVLETLKAHTEQLMIEKEKALLPITQPIIERLHKIRDLNRNNCDINSDVLIKRYQEREALYKLRANRNELIANGLRMKICEINISETLTDSDQSDEERQQIRKVHAKLPQVLQDNIKTWSEIRREMKSIQGKHRANETILARLYRKNRQREAMIQQYYDTGIINADYVTESDTDHEYEDVEKKTRKRRVFIRTCPQQDCKGFLNQQWICGMCNTHVCSKCHEVKPSDKTLEHVCNTESLATAELLMKDTKACPQCSVQIHKIDGCNMMFCTQCHTPFCWKTGEIIKNERVHNPHYYEWLRQNSADGVIRREPGDDPCGMDDQGRITMRSLRLKLQDCDLLSYDLEDVLWNVHRMHLHIEMVEIPHLRYTTNNNTDIRINYMLNLYTDTTWKHELYKRQKRFDKHTAIRQVFEMIYTVVREEFQKIMTTNPLLFQHVLDCLTTIENLRNYANNQFFEISKLYQCKVPKIMETTWNITNQKADTRVRIRRKEKEDETNKTNNITVYKDDVTTTTIDTDSDSDSDSDTDSNTG